VTDGLLLLHAFPLDASMWAPQVEGFRERLPVLAPNLPGFGGTAPVGPVLTMEAAAEAVARVVGEAEVERVVVCGLSMGGYVAFEFWRRHREVVAGLVLANTRAEPDDEPTRRRREDLARRLLAEGNGFLVADPPPLLSPDAPPELWERVRAIIRAQSAPAVAAASRGLAVRPDSRPDLPRIDVPTLVLTSTGDAMIPPEVTATMAERIPGARLVSIEGAGHLSNLEAPDAFNAALGEHLARCGALTG
jgi:3-oxoadipate enol-lactonase